MTSRTLTLGLALAFSAATALAQQDPGLNNLVHAPDYKTAEPGTLGAVVERGSGKVDVVMVSGFGLGASAFDGFMQRNTKRYHMLAITLPGFEGTAAPPMPAEGTSYGDQTWTRAAADAVVKLIGERKLRRPILVGHSLNGTQVAALVATEHPELVRGLVLLAGSPRFEPVQPTEFWPAGLSVEKKIVMVDKGLAPRWFKTVTRDTWVTNNFKAADYSVDDARGKTFADRANDPPLPVLIRYLCEFHASDVTPALAKSTLPILLIEPTFTPALRADPKKSYLESFFGLPWKGALAPGATRSIVTVDDAGIMVMDDKPAEVDKAVAEFVKKAR